MIHTRRSLLFILILAFLGGIFAPTISFAQFDQRCWREPACVEFRMTEPYNTTPLASMTQDEAQKGFYWGTDAKETCGGGLDVDGQTRIGFCLPTTQTITKITFGGQTQFKDLGQFIQAMYQYAIVLAGILAVLMIIFAGVQWIFSGGNTEQITSARKKITGSIVGVLIALLSYTILNTINPYLVNLRLPQIWAINTQNFVPTSCLDLVDKEIALFGPVNPFMSAKEKQEKFKTFPQNFPIPITKQKDPPQVFATPNDPTKTPVCGYEYAVKDAGSQSCLGSVCQSGFVCGSQTYTTSPWSSHGWWQSIKGWAPGVNNNIFSAVTKVTPVPSCQNAELFLHYMVSDFGQEHVPDGIARTVAGNLANVLEGPSWLDSNGGDQFYIVPVCVDRTAKTVQTGEPVEWSGGNHKMSVGIIDGDTDQSSKSFYEYIVKIKGFTNEKWDCKGNGEAVGVIVMNELAIAGESFDELMFVGRIGKTTQAVAGGGKNINLTNNTILLSDLKKGVALDVRVTQSVIDSLFNFTE